MNKSSEEESNNNGSTKKWFSVIDAVMFIIVSSIIWMICISQAWKTGDWVGGSHIPIPEKAVLIAFLPSIIDAVTGIVCLGFWIRSRSSTLITLFVTSLVMAGFQFLITGWFLAMGSIT